MDNNACKSSKVQGVPTIEVYYTGKTKSDSDDYGVIKFFAPWCGHRRNLTPINLQLAESMIDSKHLRYVEIDGEAQGGTETKRLDEKSGEEWRERLEKVKKDQAEGRRWIEEEKERQFQEELMRSS
ncbi:hypothetical protein BLNAU_5542 [Blattamonas nauphoetae]|uniref:Thioredoxin domain-containing protein n=1 Tax=Blattamonas nauphoetae TaxID=2049346 RepID=A0ABQ9Y704_9EUKA|nr:hypothetical protein BLNAU_5542 [Blattamonas nauphoetae]